jgi:hypothetical protein
LSEVRDRFRGTIEKSFTRGQLRRLLRKAGFEKIEVIAVPSGRSALRMGDVPRYRRWLARFHSFLQQNFPRFFGAYQIFAMKAGEASGKRQEWPEFLRMPGGKGKLHHQGNQWIGEKASYPDYRGVPVLVHDDRIENAS